MVKNKSLSIGLFRSLSALVLVFFAWSMVAQLVAEQPTPTQVQNNPPPPPPLPGKNKTSPSGKKVASKQVKQEVVKKDDWMKQIKAKPALKSVKDRALPEAKQEPENLLSQIKKGINLQKASDRVIAEAPAEEENLLTQIKKGRKLKKEVPKAEVLAAQQVAQKSIQDNKNTQLTMDLMDQYDARFKFGAFEKMNSEQINQLVESFEKVAIDARQKVYEAFINLCERIKLGSEEEGDVARKKFLTELLKEYESAKKLVMRRAVAQPSAPSKPQESGTKRPRPVKPQKPVQKPTPPVKKSGPVRK